MTRILVIDDDLSVGTAIRMILAQQGCDVELAPDARAGLRAFEASRFDVVIVDIFMPGMDGLKTIAEFRQLTPMVRIVAMSGFRFHDSMGPGMDFLKLATTIGATSSLSKPFTPLQLMAAISSASEVTEKTARQGTMR
jgi:DNA-binding NtrC family response regulator